MGASVHLRREMHSNQSLVLIPEAFFQGTGLKCLATPAAFPSEKFMLIYTKRGAAPEKVQLQKTWSHLNRPNMTMRNWVLLKSSEGWSNVLEHSWGGGGAASGRSRKMGKQLPWVWRGAERWALPHILSPDCRLVHGITRSWWFNHGRRLMEGLTCTTGGHAAKRFQMPSTVPSTHHVRGRWGSVGKQLGELVEESKAKRSGPSRLPKAGCLVLCVMGCLSCWPLWADNAAGSPSIQVSGGYWKEAKESEQLFWGFHLQGDEIWSGKFLSLPPPPPPAIAYSKSGVF